MPELEDNLLYPLKLSILPKEKVWGGDRLRRILGPSVPAGQRIGEAWVVWDGLTIDNGPFRGRSLADLLHSHPLQLLGARFHAQIPTIFPLLVKLLDARETLSVQVHPDDAYARQWEGEPFGKAEMWIVLEAEPGSTLIRGLKHSISRREAEEAVETGALQDKLEYVEVTAGDVILNPPGTIHAVCSGLLLYELQQASDLTYRFYDWNRNDPARELHLQKALDVANLEPHSRHKIQPVEIHEAGATRLYLAACEPFAAELLRVHDRVFESPAGACFHVLTVLEGYGRVETAMRQGKPGAIQLEPGTSLLIPANLHEYEIQCEEGTLVVVKAYVPDLVSDILTPLRQKGIADETILQLGGEPAHSDLARHTSQLDAHV